ncbi:MAG: hypothetical protein U9R75_11575 [Candidatus Thermoplasmatota archaeon]|nr:hypothetical protein [Candidatus Thermoplasmatota archaeon]
MEMELLILASMVLLIVLGLVLALRGYKLMEKFMRIFGGIILAVTFMFIGFMIGFYLGGIWVFVLGPALGILGFIIGFIFAPKIFWMILAMVVFALCFGLGWRLGENLELDKLFIWLVAFGAGLVGSWLFGMLARKLLVAATSLIGGIMVAVGVFNILIDEFDLAMAGGIAAACLVLVGGIGYLLQRGSKKKK